MRRMMLQGARLYYPEGDGFPDASSTGVQNGISLTPVDGNGLDDNLYVSTANNQTIENIALTDGGFFISHSGVTLRNCSVVALTDLVGGAVYVSGANCIVEYCDISGNQSEGIKGIWIDGGNGTIVRFCDISFSEDGIYFFANDVQIRDNYIHDLTTAGVDPHHDHLQFAGTGLIIDHNSLIAALDCNACCQFANGTDTVAVTINNNLMRPGDEGAFAMNVADGAVDHETITVTNNVIEASTVGGSPDNRYVTFNFRPPEVWSGNTDYDTGETIPAPE